MKLTDNQIEYLLSVSNQDGSGKKPTLKTKRIFKAELEVWKATFEYEKNKREKRADLSLSSKAKVPTDLKEVSKVTNIDTHQQQILAASSVDISKKLDKTTSDIKTCSTAYSIKSMDINLKFFKNELFCSSLIEYISNTYDVKCYISSDDQKKKNIAIQIQLTGVQNSIENAYKDLQSLFETVNTKIFNNEVIDEKVIYWSKNLYCDSDITVIQKIFDKQKLFTVWRKTDILSGYYVVHYFTKTDVFSVSENYINQIIYKEILYIQDIIIPEFENIQKNFRKKIEQFITKKKQEQQRLETYTIIYCIYPGQTELKISFFGQNFLVKRAARQLKYLINQNQLTTFTTEFTLTQRNYLLDNCVHQLENIEHEYKDDNVKIRIRENQLYVPHYLKIKIQQRINNLIDQQYPITFQYIGNDSILTNNEKLQLEEIAGRFKCQIDKIDLQTKKEIITLPKITNTSTSKSTPKLIIKQSKEFYYSLSISKKTLISNSTIELHLVNDLTAPKADITIVSMITNDIEDNSKLNDNNLHNKKDIDKNVKLFYSLPDWSKVNNDQNDTDFKISIKTFISNSLRDISILSINKEIIITFSTDGWENYLNKKRLAEEIINEIKVQLETSKLSNFHWRILFIFNDKQIDLYNQFLQKILLLTMKINHYEQFFYPISSVTISLIASKDSNIVKCRQAINSYMRKSKFAMIEIHNAFNVEIWNQHLINIFYKYCLEKFVLPKISLTNRRLILIGSIFAVNEVKQKYEFIEEILKQKNLGSIAYAKKSSYRLTSTMQMFGNMADAFNIIISCSVNDKTFSQLLADRLIDEGYLVHVNRYNAPTAIIRQKFQKSDLILVLFSQNYTTDENCLADLKFAQTIKKKILPVFLTKNFLEQDWIHYITTQELYYELFGEEIRFELDENFDLKYDKLLIEILHHTKPGLVGHTYSVSQNVFNEDQQQQQKTSERQNSSLRLTTEQIEQRRKIYKEKVKELIERQKIPTYLLEEFIELAKIVIEDYKNGGFRYDENKSRDEEKTYELNDYTIVFLSSIERWIEKASNGSAILGNIPPFTLTGDFNDAIFPVIYKDKEAWWTKNAYPPLDHIIANDDSNYLSSIIGSWYNQREASHYFQKLIDRDVQLRENRKDKVPEVVQHIINENNRLDMKLFKAISYTDFTTEIKKGTTGWDITQDSLILKQYRVKQKKKITEKSKKKPTLWNRIIEQTVELIRNINENKITSDSNILQGKIGNELKTRKEIRTQNELDNPNNKRWKTKHRSPHRANFIQQQIQNIIEFEKFCNTSSRQSIKTN
ncbi:unnamed protein product [Rotaria sordida]|uniref:TIR domain-containing protein n=1 Tax=Rotaria sordida TaxID=392033 RepID=A0A818ZIC9_9BILA|nr:unnamed protein product [Rotaria sordida]